MVVGDVMMSWLLPKDCTEFLLILTVAMVMDFIYPYHSGLMLIIHPVHTSYVMALKLHKHLPKTKASGIIIWFIVVITHTVPYVLILYLSSFNRLLWVLTSSYILKVSISLRLLLIHVRNVEFGLRSGDINYARQYVSGIVRRDVSKLGEGHIASATIESLFESLVDGFTSPLLYYTFLGPIGALLQRLVNSLDSALGYRTDEFINTGWFSAKVDTIINYIPSRVTSLLIVLLCPLVNGSLKRSLTTYLRDRGKTESVNAGSIFASVSGCLSVRLEKINTYCIGSEFNLPKHEDISKSVRLALITTTSYILLIYLLFTTYNTFLEGGLIA